MKQEEKEKEQQEEQQEEEEEEVSTGKVDQSCKLELHLNFSQKHLQLQNHTKVPLDIQHCSCVDDVDFTLK